MMDFFPADLPSKNRIYLHAEDLRFVHFNKPDLPCPVRAGEATRNVAAGV